MRGGTDLHGIIDFTDVPEHLKHMVQNYQVNLIDIRRYENFDMLHTDVKTVFELIRDSTDKEKWAKKVKETIELDKDALAVVAAYTNMKNVDTLIEKYETEGGNVDMCKAWDDRLEEGRLEGREETLIHLIRKGLLSISDAAKEFRVSETRLQELIKTEELMAETVV